MIAGLFARPFHHLQARAGVIHSDYSDTFVKMFDNTSMMMMMRTLIVQVCFKYSIENSLACNSLCLPTLC